MIHFLHTLGGALIFAGFMFGLASLFALPVFSEYSARWSWRLFAGAGLSIFLAMLCLGAK